MGPKHLFIALVSLTYSVYGQVGENNQMPGLPNVSDIMIEDVQEIQRQQDQLRQQDQQIIDQQQRQQIQQRQQDQQIREQQQAQQIQQRQQDEQIRQQQQVQLRQQDQQRVQQQQIQKLTQDQRIMQQQQAEAQQQIRDQQRQLQQQQIAQQQIVDGQQRRDQQRLIDQQLINQRRGPNVPPTDTPITAGNIQVVYNDELREMMRTYDITVEEIRKMLEMYANGGSATITKTRRNPDTGAQEVVTLDFEQFTNRPGGTRVPIITPDAGPLPGGQPEPILKPGDGPDVTSPAEPKLEQLMDAESFLKQKIMDLDAQLLALDNAYRNGQLTRMTRNENAITNRQERREAERDLRTIQQEISRMTPRAQRLLPPREVPGPGGPLDPIMRPIERPEDGNVGLQQLGDDVNRMGPFPETAFPSGGPSRRMENNIRRIEEENRRLLMRLRDLQRRSMMTDPRRREAGISMRNDLDSERFATGRPSYGLLREELLRIRAREMDILRRLRLLSSRYSQLVNRGRLPLSSNGLRPTLNRRISFNGGGPSLTGRRTLSGSVNGGMIQNPRMRVM